MDRIKEIREKQSKSCYLNSQAAFIITEQHQDIEYLLSLISSLESDKARLIEAAEPLTERIRKYDSANWNEYEADELIDGIGIENDLRTLSTVVKEVKGR